MNQRRRCSPKDYNMFLLVTMATEFPPPIRDLQAAAADALRPGYAFFLFPARRDGRWKRRFPITGGIPQRCIAPARLEILFLFSLTAPRTVMYGHLYAGPGGRNSSVRMAPWRLILAAMLYVGHLKYYKKLM
ncbi:hypothetical protein Trydic_g18921 [Trypoxylus dichotomus]